MGLKQQKRKLLAQFSQKIASAKYIRSCYDRWHRCGMIKKALMMRYPLSGHICHEETGENKELFKLYDAANGDRVRSTCANSYSSTIFGYPRGKVHVCVPSL